MTITLPRTRWFPAGALKVTHKHSDAVVYCYTNGKGLPAVVAYAGKSAKPVFCFYYGNEADRERKVRAFFAGREAVLALKAERRTAARKPHGFEIGHVLVASWGYEQTNVDWFEVTKIVSPTMIEVRPIRSMADHEGCDRGRTMPLIGEFKGEATRHRVTRGSVKISECVRASLWDGRPMYWSSYH